MESPSKSAIACVLFFACGMLAGSFITDSLNGPQERFSWETVLDSLSAGSGTDAATAQPLPERSGRQAGTARPGILERVFSRKAGSWRAWDPAPGYRDAPSALGPEPAAGAAPPGAGKPPASAQGPARTPAQARAQSVIPSVLSPQMPGKERGRFVSTLPGVRVENDDPAPRRVEAQASAQERRRPPDFDGRKRGTGSNSYGMAGSGLDGASLESRRRDREGQKQPKAPLFKPPSLKDWLGKGPVKPPEGGLAAPSFSKLKDKFPSSLPDGKPFERGTPPPAHIETLAAPQEHPDYPRWLDKDERRRRKDEPHWHIDASNTPFYHMGKVWGRTDAGRWTWMVQSERRWWTVGDGAQRMVRHADH